MPTAASAIATAAKTESRNATERSSETDCATASRAVRTSKTGWSGSSESTSRRIAGASDSARRARVVAFREGAALDDGDAQGAEEVGADDAVGHGGPFGGRERRPAVDLEGGAHVAPAERQ